MANIEMKGVSCFASLEALSRAAADEVCALSRTAIQERGRFICAFAGGSTPRRLYQLLAGPPYCERIDWARVEIFFGDERCVPPEQTESNFRLVKENLLDRIGLPAPRVHRIHGEAADLDAEARRYQEEMASVFGNPSTDSPPSLDLILLGLGADGHTASLFPDQPALAETQRWFVATRSPAAPHDRITATLPLLNAARVVIFLVAGEEKAAALRNILAGAHDPRRFPAQLVAPAGRLAWFVDQAAASDLEKTTRLGKIT